MTTAHHTPPFPVARLAIVGVICVALLYAAFYLYTSGQGLFGAIMLALAVGVGVVFGADRFYGTRFIFPGVAAVLIFIAFPVLYTIYLGFTNYSSFNLLTYDRTVEVLTSRTIVDETSKTKFAVSPDGDAYRIWLPDMGLLSDPVPLSGAAETTLTPATAPADLLATRDAIKLRSGLQELTLTTPDGVTLKNAGLRDFASIAPEYVVISATQLRRTTDGMILTADHDTGFFVDETGQNVPPGWRVNIGVDNFSKIFQSEGIRGPMITIFLWTVVFAVLSVVGTFALGLTLAVILQWEHLRGKAIYRILLILPYGCRPLSRSLFFEGCSTKTLGKST